MKFDGLFHTHDIDSIAFLDFETTGLNPISDHPTEVGVFKIGLSEFGAPYVKSYNSKIQLPEGVEVPEFITKLTGLTTEKVNSEGKPAVEVAEDLAELISPERTMVVAHNANFDLGFLANHFFIIPDHFMDTRAIEILTDPSQNASLEPTYKRYFPERDIEQTHRALDDVMLMLGVFGAQIEKHGYDAMIFFKNKALRMPDRDLVYTPVNAIVLDFTEKYVSKRAYEEVQQDAEKYQRLEAYGVDNWGGYGEAMSDSEGIFEEEE